MEKVNIRSLRTIAKIVGTLICICGALSIVLLKGPKLLNATIIPSKSIMAGSDTDKNWLLGCVFLLASSVAWSFWLILQVLNFSTIKVLNNGLCLRDFSRHRC